MSTSLPRWELAAENIAVKIRWFGLLVGYLLVNLGPDEGHRLVLNAILVVGVGYTLCDTWYSWRGKILLRQFPLLISVMEALFIALLCYYHRGLDSAFRHYYLLSVICCAIRHRSAVTYATWALHSVSYVCLYFALPAERRDATTLVLMLVMLGWVTWASASLAGLLKRVGEDLRRLNRALAENQAQLEQRIAERTGELQKTQALVLHQEKMAAFGLLAAGIAHEVGNPLTSISTLVQMLQRRDTDAYTQERLQLVSGQLERIQAIVRELVNFSRPASSTRARVAVASVVQEALNIAKYYKRTKGRDLTTDLPPDLPAVLGVRDQLVQVVMNLVFNAIDATDTGGHVVVQARADGDCVVLSVRDNGPGISKAHQARLFQPYFTTKKTGTGLGLFVTHQLVVDHGGTITCESTGVGATFIVRLPALVEPRAVSVPEQEPTAQAALGSPLL